MLPARCQYETIEFTVSANDEFRVKATVVSRELKELLCRGNPPDIDLSNLLPVPGDRWQRLTRWQGIARGVDYVLKSFESSVGKAGPMEFARTGLCLLLNRMSDLGLNTHTTHPAIRLLCEVEDGQNVVPWEILIHSYCHATSSPPLVFRRGTESGSPCKPAVVVDLLGFPKVLSGGRPRDLDDMTHLLGSMLGTQEAEPWAKAIIAEHQPADGARIDGTIRRVDRKKWGSKQDCINELRETEDSGIQVLLGASTAQCGLHLVNGWELASRDLAPGKAPPALCAVLPVSWGKKRLPANGWGRWSRTAFDQCSRASIGLSSTVPLPPGMAVSLAKHGILASLKGASSTAGRSAGLAIAELLVGAVAQHAGRSPRRLRPAHVAITGDIRYDIMGPAPGPDHAALLEAANEAEESLVEGEIESALEALRLVDDASTRRRATALLTMYRANKMDAGGSLNQERWQQLLARTIDQTQDIIGRLRELADN